MLYWAIMTGLLANTRFIFTGYENQLAQGQLIFRYRLERPREIHDFEEVFRWRGEQKSADLAAPLLIPIIEALYVLAGMSYWKAWCPQTIEMPTIALTQPQADFFATVYTKGLGEFFYKNNIDFRGLVTFPATATVAMPPVSKSMNNRSLLMVGGGKDSIVSAELLKSGQKLWTNFVLHPIPLQETIMSLMGGEILRVERELDKKLFALNKTEGVFNGHVPISSLYAFTALLAAALYDYRYVIASNERSANEGNVEYLGEMINHQWSKSLEFEKLCQEYVHAFISPDITYFSLLRPLSEIKIVELFTRYPAYFEVFSSCNRNFTLTGEKSTKRWCGECPKCAFVFACLAAFLPKETVLNIFDKDLFADAALLPLYQELLGLMNTKPFECVGSPEETALAFRLAHDSGFYQGESIMEMFGSEASKRFADTATLKKQLLTPVDEQLLPDDFSKALLF